MSYQLLLMNELEVFIMTEEIWKNVVGYEGLYQVSNLGGVKSLDYKHTGKEKIMKPFKNKKCYLYVYLYKNDERKIFRVHRLVAAAFIPNPENKPCIDHINTIRDDNRVDNLSWVTYKENTNNPISLKRLLDKSPTVGKFGKDHFRARPVYQYSLDGKLVRKWNCIADAVNGICISHGNIIACCLGNRKTCGGFIWQYA